MKKVLLLAACSLLIAAAPAVAHGPHEHAAHEHGAARLDVAVEGSTVEISLESPLANALPFEHAPRNAAQRQAVQNMAATLRQAENIFVFPKSAQCRSKNVTLESEVLPAALLEAKAGQPREQAHSGQNSPAVAAADAHHEHEAHHADDHSTEHGGHEGHDGHADMDASFTFTCAQPEALRGMDVRLFSVWPDLHELRVQIVSPSGQHSAELTREARSLTW